MMSATRYLGSRYPSKSPKFRFEGHDGEQTVLLRMTERCLPGKERNSAVTSLVVTSEIESL